MRDLRPIDPHDDITKRVTAVQPAVVPAGPRTTATRTLLELAENTDEPEIAERLRAAAEVISGPGVDTSAASERTAIVAFLRKHAGQYPGPIGGPLLASFAKSIERGDHLKR